MPSYDPAHAVMQSRLRRGFCDVESQLDYAEDCRRRASERSEHHEVLGNVIRFLRARLDNGTTEISVKDYRKLYADAKEVRRLRLKIEYTRKMLRWRNHQFDELNRQRHEIDIARLQGQSAGREEIARITHKKNSN